MTEPNTVAIPIVYGSISFWLGKKADDQNSHKWVCYLRGLNGEDLSWFIDKVVFTLHPSFRNPVRTISSFPFEIQETGWGEFEIAIKIFFKQDYIDQPLEFFHGLKLYPTASNVTQSTKKPVVAENYDEIVFVNPSTAFVKLWEEKRLSSGPAIVAPTQSRMEEEAPNRDNPAGGDNEPSKMTDLSPYYTKFDEKAHRVLLEDALAFIKAEIIKVRDKINDVDQDIVRLRSSK
eukprot:TRINITY_DN12369_c0_g1_i12.p2 TRINITY_DN12369_c0_g1~~TRINITY_DN12369_c0_g1_i12.p2  ORF type:complete len:233 (-),score=49.66 TRINITY_DN12369_c0_g1_i12:1447-2145(-)